MAKTVTTVIKSRVRLKRKPKLGWSKKLLKEKESR